jgi:hypothetical protein
MSARAQDIHQTINPAQIQQHSSSNVCSLGGTLSFFNKMKAIILLPPPEASDGETALQCMRCGQLKLVSEFRDSNDCIECDDLPVVDFVTHPQTRLGSSERPNNKEASYSKHGNHQENFSATKYIKP